MTKTVYFPFVGNQSGGGPHVFVFKFARALVKRGYRVIYDSPQKADVALAIIQSEKLLRKIKNRKKTKIFVRIDGAYYKEYWHGGPGREWRDDMSSLHNAIKRDFDEKTGVDHIIFQSQFSKDMICEEIANRKNNFSIIHNGVDVQLFRPIKQIDDDFTKLFHIGKVRNGYIMESLIGTYEELKKRGNKVKLYIAGNMDAECNKVFQNFKIKKDPNVIHLGACSNTKAPSMFAYGDIYLGPRMGSSNDNVIVEAQASGLPCVIPAWGGNQELIKDGQTGVVVDGGKWDYDGKYIQNLADGVERIVKEGLRDYQIRARKHAVLNLNIEKMVERYIRVMGV